MISNQYQNQPNFQGNLLKEGLKLPKKFNEVAKIYAERSKGMPDLKLSGQKNRCDFNGYFYHSTNAIINGENVASIPTGSLKKMFKYYSPKEMAQELINITKEFALNEKFFKLTKEIDNLYAKINSIRERLQYITVPKAKERLQVVLERMERTLAKKEEILAEVKSTRNKISNEWCM